MQTHQWEWIDQSERFAFGDPNKPYAVDQWRCSACGKVVTTRGEPKPGRCRPRRAACP